MRASCGGRDEAVSPVVGMVLMLGITVILAGIVYVYSSGVAGDNVNENGPALGIRVDESRDRIDVITVETGLQWNEFRLIPDKDVRYNLNGPAAYASDDATADIGAPLVGFTGTVQAGNFVAFCVDGSVARDVTIRFIHIETNSQATQEAAFETVNPCPADDQDGDGVLDPFDECPTTSDPSIGDVDGDGCDDVEDDDADNDGLTKAEEAALGTDDLKVDSDEDGRHDIDETRPDKTYDEGIDTDPAEADTDGDGVLDGQDRCALAGEHNPGIGGSAVDNDKDGCWVSENEGFGPDPPQDDDDEDENVPEDYHPPTPSS